MPSVQRAVNWFKRHKILTSILVLIILCLIVGAASGSRQTSNASKPSVTQINTSTSPATPVATQPSAQTNLVSQDAAENYCQDAGLLGKYVDIKTTDIVTLSYSPQYVDSGVQASNGDEIWDLQWTGKDKTTGASVSFVCMVSGTDKTINLHELAINGAAVYGPADER